MTRYADLPDPVAKAARVVRDAVSKHGLVLHMAKDRTVDEQLFSNVAAYMWGCRYGVAFRVRGERISRLRLFEPHSRILICTLRTPHVRILPREFL